MLSPKDNDNAVFKLFQLISPSLPIGGFTYSQGIEWAVEENWISDADDLGRWVKDLLDSALLNLELPLLKRFHESWSIEDLSEVKRWNQFLIASRETYELRQEEINRARAMSTLIGNLEASSRCHLELLKQTQTACYAFACVKWEINLRRSCEGFVWSWIENLVLSAVKIIPLGQTDGQRLLLSLGKLIPLVIDKAMLVEDKEVGCSNQALAIASTLHETQYTRIFRS